MKFRFACFAALTALLLFTGVHVHASVPPIPLQLSAGTWRPLSAHEDGSLEDRLARALNRNPFWQSLLSEEKMAVGVVDLADPEAPRFAQVNGSTMMYVGSLAKIAVLLSAFHGFEDGSLPESLAVQKDLMGMIRRSDNAAANRVIERIGLHKIEAVVKNPRYGFYDPAQGGGIWLGRLFANSGEINPEPIKGLVHAATVTQVCRFYYLLTTGKIISTERSRQMLQILSCPELHDKFVSVMKRAVPLKHLYRKSGTWRAWHSDSVLVWDETGGQYILVAMVESVHGEGILRQLVPVVRQLLKAKESP